MAANPVELGEFGTIIIGAGSAGCLLANRLSADPSHKVLLLEAGGKDDAMWLHIPIGYRYTIGDPRYDWCFQTAAEPELKNRSISHPRGKVIGGSSAINGMFQIRGQSVDYDHWRDLGNPGWSWNEVLPFFKAHENFEFGESEMHGAKGELYVQQSRAAWPVLDAVADAAVDAGLPRLNDFNLGDNEGVGPVHFTQKRGRRWSSASAFLKPALRRANLHLVTDALVDRLTFEGKRATGVEYEIAGQKHRARAAREVILSAGSLCTPPIMMRSGLGPAAHLRERGIELVSDLPGVGANLQDHLQLHLCYKLEGTSTLNNQYHSLPGRMAMGVQYALFQRGPLSMGPSPLGMFARSDPRSERANLAIIALPFSRDGTKATSPFHRFPGITMNMYELRPASRGHVRLKSADAHELPEVLFNYLSAPADRQVAIDSIRLARRIMRQKPLAQFRPTEIAPRPETRDEDDDGLLDMFRSYSTTVFHPVGTAKMGPASDPSAVVDARLRVNGVEHLRVIDASVVPLVSSGNTNAPTLMIAEKGAAMIREDAGK